MQTDHIERKPAYHCTQDNIEGSIGLVANGSILVPFIQRDQMLLPLSGLKLRLCS